MPYFNYPLRLRFKLIALSPQIIVTDAAGQQIAYVHQKVWNIREDIRIFSDESRSREVFRISADRVFDFNTKYHFFNSANNQPIGYVQPAGLRSIWRATYRVHDEGGAVSHHIKEDNAFIKILDALVSEIPFVNLFTGYFLNPAYTVFAGPDIEDTSRPVMHLKKEPAFWEGVFTIDMLNQMSEIEEMRSLLAMMLMIQFMRRRG